MATTDTSAACVVSQRDAAAIRETSARHQSRLHQIQTQHVIDAMAQGRDELLPKVSDHGEPRRVSEWLSNCDARQEALIFQLVHQALCRDNPQALYEVAAELAEYVGREFADAYVVYLED